MSEDYDEDGQEEHGILEKIRIKRPSLYRVLMHNDDYSTMEFVIIVLERFFNKNSLEAEQIMFEIHNKGLGLCGVYTKDIAQTKMVQVSKFAQEQKYPLKVTIEVE